jgi:hypothetical protein
LVSIEGYLIYGIRQQLVHGTGQTADSRIADVNTWSKSKFRFKNGRTNVRLFVVDGATVAVSSMMATSNNTPANDDFHRLLLVVKELAQQLDENRQAATKLKLHADLLKVVFFAQS